MLKIQSKRRKVSVYERYWSHIKNYSVSAADNVIQRFYPKLQAKVILRTSSGTKFEGELDDRDFRKEKSRPLWSKPEGIKSFAMKKLGETDERQL